MKNVFHKNRFIFVLFQDGRILQNHSSRIPKKRKNSNFLDISDFYELCSTSRVVSIAPGVDSLFLLDDGVVYQYNVSEQIYSFVADNIQRIDSNYLLNNEGQLFNNAMRRIDNLQETIIDFTVWEDNILTWHSNNELQLLKRGNFLTVNTPLSQLFHIPNKSARK